ncbi:unnamed protein product [Miscanthus lutarioriparius]|uniref:Uncharacterized protein n=1 Tax=Miscanthus lutarioriparius TaxID=422564 RepID=A0A811PLC1_9POAL|nr:unnamed protein product [Miscanthus lutarioriparius]
MTTYHSVCTIVKVKTALERFERGKQQQPHPHQQQQHSGAGASPSSSFVTTSSVKRHGVGVEQGDGCDSPSGGGGGMVAVACSRCFLYVLISWTDLRCESHVLALPAPAPAVSKKPRIDLNVGYLGTTSSRTYTGSTHDIAAVSCMNGVAGVAPGSTRRWAAAGTGTRRTAEATRRTWRCC